MDEGGSGQGCFAGKLYTTGSIEATTPRVRWEGGKGGREREKALGLPCSSHFSLMSAARQQEESQRQRRRGRWVCGEQERFLRGSRRPRNSSVLLTPSILNSKAQQHASRRPVITIPFSKQKANTDAPSLRSALSRIEFLCRCAACSPFSCHSSPFCPLLRAAVLGGDLNCIW